MEKRQQKDAESYFRVFSSNNPVRLNDIDFIHVIAKTAKVTAREGYAYKDSVSTER